MKPTGSWFVWSSAADRMLHPFSQRGKGGQPRKHVMLSVLLLVLALPCFAQVGPVRIGITPANVAITAGGSQQLTAKISFLGNRTNGTDVTNQVTWQSSDMTIASVSNTGKVTAIAHGVVTITAIHAPFRGSTTLTVIPSAALTSVTVAPANPLIPKGLTQKFNAVGHFSGTDQDITLIATWASTNSAVATVTASGLAQSRGQGSTTISASYSSVTGSATLNVAPAALASITVTPASPSVHPGTNLQLMATGIFTDGTNQNVTNSVSWSSDNTGVAGVSASGLVSAFNAGNANITATGSGFMGAVVTGRTTVLVPALVSIAVTPANPTIVQGGSLQLSATGSYSDGSTMDLTGTATWSSSNATAVPVTSTGLVTGNGAGLGTITATLGAISGSTSVLVSFSALSVNGHYAFSLTGADPDGEFLAAGSFQADGHGHISSGVEDFNGGKGVQSNVAFSGSYTVGADGRGSAMLSTGDTFKFVMTASGNAVVIQFNTLAVAWGSIALQNPSAFQNLQGNFAFELSGLGVTSSIADIGAFTADGGGGISSGQEDINDAGTVKSLTFTGSYTSPDSNGRGTATLHSSDGKTSHYSYYIVAADHVNLVSLDFVPAYLGVAQLRSGATFSNTSFSGFYVFSESGVTSGDAFKTARLFNAAGVFFANGSGTMNNGEQDSNEGGIVTENAGVSGTYNVSSSGRGTATIDTFPYVFYVVTPNLAFFMNTDSGAVLTRTARSQPAVAFSTASFQGNFNLLLSGEDLINQTFLAMSGEMFADGSGTLSGTEEINDNGSLSANVPLNGTYSVDIDGRGSGSINGPNGTLTIHFYMINTDEAVFIETDNKNDQIGSAQVQF
jgi:uncharacterized protein YjdB